MTVWFWGVLLFVLQANAQLMPHGSTELTGATVSDGVPNGFHIFGATLSAGYSSSLAWLGSTWRPVVRSPIFYEGASVLTGYTHVDRRSRLLISYTPEFTGLNGIGGLHFLNQRFNLGYSRSYGPKWTLGFRGEAADSTFPDLLFLTGSSDALSNATSAAAGTTGDTRIPNPQTGLYGDRQFMFTARIRFEYKPSNRISIAVETGVDQVQPLHQSGTLSPLIERARSEIANAALSYAFSTRTELQTIATTSDTQSPFARYQVSTFSERVQRKVTPKWWLWLEAGAGSYRTHFSSIKHSSLTSYIARGGAGYAGRANKFGFTFDKGISDSFGLGSGSRYGFEANWEWRRPGSNWSFNAGGTQQRLTGGYLGDISLWQAGAGVTRSLSAGTYVRAEYGYLLNTYVPDGVTTKPHVQGVRITLGWNGLGYGRSRLPVPTPGHSPTD